MNTSVIGPNITLNFNANELTENYYTYTLPKGYSINIMHITNVTNIWTISSAHVLNNTKLVFPVVNSKSPSSITLFIMDLTKTAEIKFTIEKFGQLPDTHYFDKAFDPILVVGDDGNKYNVIPSDQFK